MLRIHYSLLLGKSKNSDYDGAEIEDPAFELDLNNITNYEGLAILALLTFKRNKDYFRTVGNILTAEKKPTNVFFVNYPMLALKIQEGETNSIKILDFAGFEY